MPPKRKTKWLEAMDELKIQISTKYPDLAQHFSRSESAHYLKYFYQPADDVLVSVERTISYIGNFIGCYRRNGSIPDPVYLGF